MIDNLEDVRKTFNDYQQESAITLNKILIKNSHPWINNSIKNIAISDNSLILVIKRKNEKIFPKGDTILQEGDEILIGTTVVKSNYDISLSETLIDKNNEWINKKIKEIEFPSNFLIAIIKRDTESFVPNGDTKIKEGDTIVFYTK